MRIGPRRWLAMPCAALALAGCGDDVSEFDAVGLRNSTSEVLGTMHNSEATQTMVVLGPKMDVGSGALTPALLAATLPDFDPRTESLIEWGARRARAFAQVASAQGPAGTAVVIPEPLRGTTFVYDAETEEYVASQETGAPSNGVRFILYQIDSDTEEVVTPLEPIGHADLTDQSTETADRLGIALVIEDEPLLEYVAGATASGGSLAFTADGFVSDGTTEVDFDLTLTLSGTGITIDYHVEVPELGVGIALNGLIMLQGVGTLTLTIEHDGNDTAIQVNAGQTSLSGTITHNGDVVVHISGTRTNPVFTDASGNSLSEQQEVALRDVANFAEDLFDAFDDLLTPAYRLFEVPL